MAKLANRNKLNFGGGSGKRPSFNPLELFSKVYGFYSRFNNWVSVALYLFLTFTDTSFWTLSIPLIVAVEFFIQKEAKPHFRRHKTLLFRLIFLVFFLVMVQFPLLGMYVQEPIGATVYGVVCCILLKLTQPTNNTIPADQYLAGARERNALTVFKEHQQVIAEKVASGMHPNEFMNFLGMQLTTIESTLGFLFLGEVRSGKSLAISMLMQVLQYPDKRAILYDYAGNYYAKLLAMGIAASRIILLMPFHRDCVEWMLSFDLTSPPITRVFFEQLIQSHDPKDKFFTTGAIDIACSVVDTLNRAARDAETKPVWGIKELCEFCTDEERLIDLLQTYPDIWRKHKGLASGSEQQQAYFGTLKNTFLQLQAAGECWYRARQLGRTVSLRDFHCSNDIILLGRDEELGGQALEYFASAVLSFCTGTIIGKPTSDDTKPASTVLIADEFQNLGKLKRLRTITTEGGKYGFCPILATQSFKLIEDIYGAGQTDAMLGNITHMAAFKISDNYTTEYLSKFFGETTVLEASTADTPTENRHGVLKMRRSTSWAEKTKPLFTPAHFKQQSKIDPQNPDNGLMGVTVRCDGNNYRMNYHWHDILAMLPPKPTAKQERLNTAPQDESLFYPQPLTDQQFIDLGLGHLADVEDKEDIDIGFGDIDFEEEEEDNDPPTMYAL